MKLLSKEKLVEMTGYRRIADQLRWLKQRGWIFETSATGAPIVLESYAEARLSGKQTANEPAWKPNLEAFRRQDAKHAKTAR